jgi:hypothetical protein
MSANAAASGPDWRAPWKKWAIAQLPSAASRAVKVEVRASVERALARFRADADEDELRDVIMAIVDGAAQNMAADAERGARKAAKAEFVNRATLFLHIALLTLKSRGALAMLKQPGYSLRRLEHRLQKYLQRQLTGDESVPKVRALVEAWVEARLAEQPQPVSRRFSGAALAARSTVIAAATVAVSHHPAVHSAAETALKKGRDFLTKLLTPPTPPPGDPSAGA